MVRRVVPYCVDVLANLSASEQFVCTCDCVKWQLPRTRGTRNAPPPGCLHTDGYSKSNADAMPFRDGDGGTVRLWLGRQMSAGILKATWMQCGEDAPYRLTPTVALLNYVAENQFDHDRWVPTR